MLQHAFKEWAVVCAALARGEQSLILRKGGVDEDFAVAHKRFWLYPTYTHQQADGIRAEARPLLQEVESARPIEGTVRLNHWAEVTGIYHVRELVPVLMLGHLHVWSEETVRKRFDYRTPGLNVLCVRIHRAPAVHALAENPAYLGCRSWVDLETGLCTEGSRPIVDDAAYREVQHSLDLLLSPTAWA